MPQDATACHRMPRHDSVSKFMPSDAADANLNLNLNRTESLLSVADAPPAQKKRFSPPSVEEVTAYCTERNNGVDARAFVDHYAASGWMRGKTPIRDWKACVRTWERNNRNSTPQTLFGGGNLIAIDN